VLTIVGVTGTLSGAPGVIDEYGFSKNERGYGRFEANASRFSAGRMSTVGILWLATLGSLQGALDDGTHVAVERVAVASVEPVDSIG